MLCHAWFTSKLWNVLVVRPFGEGLSVAYTQKKNAFFNKQSLYSHKNKVHLFIQIKKEKKIRSQTQSKRSFCHAVLFFVVKITFYQCIERHVQYVQHRSQERRTLLLAHFVANTSLRTRELLWALSIKSHVGYTGVEWLIRRIEINAERHWK